MKLGEEAGRGMGWNCVDRKGDTVVKASDCFIRRFGIPIEVNK